MIRNKLETPPHLRTNKILSDYYKNLESMDRIDALVIYRNNMGRLYKTYNPSLYIRFWKREDFFPKQEVYYED